jgi:uncharacterized protein with NAD-binding domain and iron-sulfur cluster
LKNEELDIKLPFFCIIFFSGATLDSILASVILMLLQHGKSVTCLLLFFQVDIYESRSFIGGKVGSFVDKRGNHIEMGLHVFFGCYNNLFRLMKKVNINCLVVVI